jgi:hypothetical protein
MAGESIMFMDPLNPFEQSRIAYQYLPGQRRVKLAPQLAFDTPNPAASGTATMDDLTTFIGSMERYNFKLIGKKEMYVPYNAYRVDLTTADEVFKPKHMNPDVLRWELHRVWVVEATLRQGKRHIYHKRRIYIDEDSWAGVCGENYDAHGKLYKVLYLLQIPRYDFPTPEATQQTVYDLTKGNYMSYPWRGIANGGRGYFKLSNTRQPEKFWTPQSMAASGIR